nr:MAG: RNA-dependent RNA polymerase [Mitovirus sp.]
MNFIKSQLVLWLKAAKFLGTLLPLGVIVLLTAPIGVIVGYFRPVTAVAVRVEAMKLAKYWRSSPLRVAMEKNGPFVKLASFKPKHVDFRWLRPYEWSRVMLRLVRLLGLPAGPSMVLADRLLTIWEKSGTPFFILYLKECRLALIAWANRSSYTPNPGCRVRLAPCGLPAVVPVGLRPSELGSAFGKLQFRGLHTVFSMYRVLDWKGATPDFSSITNPFVGVSQVLPFPELKTVMALFWVPEWLAFAGHTVPWESTSSGPNHPWSTWSSAKDTFAWATSPIIMMWFIVWCVRSRQYLLALWLLVLSHLILPVAIFILIRGSVFKLGRLATLAKDGGGKRRIVGVVDFWSQWALKPLHQFLFRLLKGIPQDGTFDQMAPIQSLLHYSRLGIPIFSFDLSSATDRLPVALQEQILTILIGPSGAKAWRKLLTSRSYFHPKVGNIKYAVGQPMGALSSWAMLAVTHHVIVQLAAYRTGWKGWYPLYALLGDDIVILRQDVATEYLSLMRYLGVPINMSKTIQSSTGLLEFAKRVVSAHHGDLSPLSGRLLVTAVRSPGGWLDVWVHILDFGFILFPNQLLKVIANLSSDVCRKPFTAINDPLIGMAVIARVFILSRLREGVVLRPRFVDEWYRAILGDAVYGPLLDKVVRTAEFLKLSAARKTDNRRAWSELKLFTTSWWRFSLFSGILGGVLSIPLLMLSPAFWVGLGTRLQSVWETLATDLSVSANFALHLSDNPHPSGQDIIEVKIEEVNIPQLYQVKPPIVDVKNTLQFWVDVSHMATAYAEFNEDQKSPLPDDSLVEVRLLAAPSSHLLATGVGEMQAARLD